MRQYIKKSILLTLSILISIVANAYDFEVGGIYFNKDGNCAIVTSGDSEYSGDVSIPSTVNYGGMEYSVTSIGYGAFEDCTGLTSVTIPNSVTSIGDYAFSGCSGLTSVTIPNSVTSIGAGAFGGCSGLTSVTIPNSVTSILGLAFYDCRGLTSVTIGNSVASIGIDVFSLCSGLSSIKVESGNTTYDSRNDCNAIIETASNTLVAGCKNTVIPNSVTSIGYGAFGGCSGLTSVTIPNSVTSIGDGAFIGCSGLTSVTISNSVKIIGSYAFSGCSGLTSVTIPNSVTSIGDEAFFNCSGLTSVHITDLAAWCKFALFDSYASNPLSYAHHLYLNGEEIKDLVIPNSVTSIGSLAFVGCDGLTSVTIPNSVTSIGHEAFAYCYNLKSVISEIEMPFTIDSSVFGEGTKNIGKLTVPKGKKSVYQSTDGWKEFSNIIEAISSYTLTIQSSSGGYVSYNGTNISATTKTFTIDEGSSVTFTITPDSGYRLASLTVNGTDVTTSVSNNQYTISNITANTSVVATFVKIVTGIEVNATNFPDDGFRDWILSNISGADDGILTDAEIAKVKVINLESKLPPKDPVTEGLRNLHGIEYFTSLDSLDCAHCQIEHLDVTKNTKLKYLRCSSNPMESIDISKNTLLTSFYCSQNGMSEIDVTKNVALKTLVCDGNLFGPLDLSNNTELEELICFYSDVARSDLSHNTKLRVLECNNSGLTSLDLSKNIALTELNCSENELTSLNVSGCMALKELNCYSNKLTSLDVSKNTKLTTLDCDDNKLKSLDVSKNTALTTLSCSSNQLTSLDVSKNTALTSLGCYSNQLTSLDVSKNIALKILYCNSNQLLNLDLSNNNSINVSYYTSIGSQTRYLTAVGISSGVAIPIPTDFDFTKLSNLKLAGTSVAGSVAMVNGQKYLVFAKTGTPESAINGKNLTYNYNTGNSLSEAASMDVTVMLSYTATTYSLSIQSSAGGSVSYDGTTVSNTTRSFTVNEGTSATITITPNSGYRLSRLTVNGTNVTSNVSNNQYTISNITANTTVIATFEQIPATTYSLSIQSGAGGSVSYDGTTVTNTTRSFTVNEGTSATITITPNTGYKLSRLTVNGTNVTSSVSNNKYTINSISANTTVIATFEQITYTLSVQAMGNGTVTYNSTATKNTTRSFTVNHGSSATLSISPDSGYRLASLKVNGTDVTSSVSNNQYTISNIIANTTVVATFEQIPITTYSLSIQSGAGGSVSYDGTTITNKTQSFTVAEGSSVTIEMTPNSGYKLESLIVNGTDVTSGVKDNQYTISNISANTNVVATFSVITYTLSIQATGSGTVTYGSNTISNTTRNYSVNYGSSATLTFKASSGYELGNLTVGGVDVTTSIIDNSYTVSNITSNTSVVATFYALASSFTADGINYGVTSFDDLTLLVKAGTYSGHLVIPSMVTHDGKTWHVTGIESGAFKNCTGLISIQIPSSCESIGNSIFEGCTGLAAVTWEPEKDLTGTMFGSITNPNLLLFTSSILYAPYGIRNVVVNGEASEVTLTDATSGNNFYCPKAFKAKSVSYTHDYSMTTGRGNSQGWETIALPFDVTTIIHETKVVLKPFGIWTQGSSERPFWLYRLTQSGWTAEKQIKANTPYIISMPNNTTYQAGYNVSGQVTFSAENATVAATSAVNTSSNGSKQFVPNFTEQTSGGSIYAINANNALGSYAGSYTEGSVFTNSPARTVHPFEAYTKSANNAKAFIPIFDTTPTGISILLGEECSNFRIYSLAGQLVRDCRNTTYEEAIRGLATGVYLVNGKKVVRK